MGLADLMLPLATVESSELWGAVVAVVAAMATAVGAGGKWLLKHFERRDLSSDAFVSGIAADTKAARAEFREELHKRDRALEGRLADFLAHLESSRDAFTRTLAEHDERYMHSMRESELNAAQRASEDRKLIERLVQIDSGSWKLGDKDRRRQRRDGPAPEQRAGG